MNCAETSGFLFHHDCGRQADANCNLCGKFICAMHTRVTEGQIFCITCLKRYLQDHPNVSPQQAVQPGLEQQQQQQQQPGSRYSSRWYTYDDPYWYTSTHYPHYHEHDFAPRDRQAFEATPADAKSGGEEAFETDKEAS